MTRHSFRSGATPSPARQLAAPRALRLLVVLAVLAVVVAGPPLLLRWLTGNPLEVPASLRSSAGLTNPIDDRTLVWLLAAFAWISWLHLLGSLILEFLQQARGSHRRMPLPGFLFGANQLLASHLVAALLLGGGATTVTGFTPARTTAGPTTAITTSASWTAAETRASPAPATPALAGPDHSHPQSTTGPAKHRSPARSGPVIECRVLPPEGRHHDTLWGIAERHLGDGTRWHDIYQLNRGRLMPDGHRLTDASYIRPGWTLYLPPDARALPLDAVTRHLPNHADIADPVRDAAHESRADTPGEAIADRTEPPARISVEPPAAPSLLAAPTEAATVDPGAAPTARAVPSKADDHTSPASSNAPTGAPRAPRPDERAPSVWEQQSQRALEVGLLGLAAAGLLTGLTRRRKIAARRRPPGTRPATPPPDLLDAEAALRRQARSADDIAAAVRLTLLLAARAGATDEPATEQAAVGDTARPPTGTSSSQRAVSVSAVWHHLDNSIELVLAPDAASPPVLPPGAGPFVATERGWLLPADQRPFLFATTRTVSLTDRLNQQLQEHADPHPLLLPVGTLGGSTCLVNLEHRGLLCVQPERVPDPYVDEDRGQVRDRGADERVVPVLAGWVLQLAGAPWFELSRILLAPPFAPLAVGTDRADVLTADDLVTLRPTQVAAHDMDDQDPGREDDPDGKRQRGVAWKSAEAGMPEPARTLEERRCLDAWDSIGTAPDVLFGFTVAELPGEILHAAHDPRRPVCVVLTDPHPDAATWTVHSDGTVTIPGIADRLAPPAITSDQLATVLRLLEHAQDPPQADHADPGLVAREHDNPPPPENPTASQVLDPTTFDTPGHALTDASPTRPQADEPDAVAEQGSVDNDSTDRDSTESDSTGDEVDGAVLPSQAADAVEGPLGGRGDASQERPPQVRIDVLGPVRITGTRSTLGDAMRQIAVYLALHRRPVQPQALWEAINPDREFNDHALRSRLNELKGYVWNQLEKAGRGRMFADTVLCDWQEFRSLATGDDDSKLQALALVRGRPFEDFQPDWVFLEGYVTDVEAAVVDLALEVATRALARGDTATAYLVATTGLKASPYEERLVQFGVRAAMEQGAPHLARALHRQLSAVLDDEISPDDTEQPATTDLMREISDLEHAARHRRTND
jgi:hypothetical protein